MADKFLAARGVHFATVFKISGSRHLNRSALFRILHAANWPFIRSGKFSLSKINHSPIRATRPDESNSHHSMENTVV
jgi:hypothetical protein